MSLLHALARRADRWQRSEGAAGFAVAVLAKFREDGGARTAAMLTYFSFLALFPMLLVFVTVLGLLLHGDPGLRHRLVDSTVASFPVIGPSLRSNVRSLPRSGLTLAVSLVWALVGARGAANMLSTALNSIWQVPKSRWPGFPWNWLRSFGVLLTTGMAVALTGALSGVGGAGSVGTAQRVGALGASTVLNVLLSVAVFRLATTGHVPTRRLLTGAVLAGLCWQALLVAAGYLVSHDLRGATEAYGTVGLVLGLFALLQIQARVTLVVAEADAVWHNRLWPRALVRPPLTQADRAAYQGYVQTQNRRPEQQVRVGFDPSATPGRPAGGGDRP